MRLEEGGDHEDMRGAGGAERSSDSSIMAEAIRLVSKSVDAPVAPTGS